MPALPGEVPVHNFKHIIPELRQRISEIFLHFQRPVNQHSVKRFADDDKSKNQPQK